MLVVLKKMVRNTKDLMEFEISLRKLYNTASGVYCQALMTTAYLKWSKDLRNLLCANTENACIETFLPGFKISYCANECVAHQILPCHFQKKSAEIMTLKRKFYSELENNDWEKEKLL